MICLLFASFDLCSVFEIGNPKKRWADFFAQGIPGVSDIRTVANRATNTNRSGLDPGRDSTLFREVA